MRLRVSKNLPVALAVFVVVAFLAIIVLYFALSGEVYGYGELVMRLPDEFETYEAKDVYDSAYSDGSIIVGILRLSFDKCASDGIPTTMSPESFAEHYKKLALSGIPTTDTVRSGDVVYYTYSMTTASGSVYTYVPTFYFSPYAYFVVTYVMPSAVWEARSDEVLEWAESVRIQPSRVE